MKLLACIRLLTDYYSKQLRAWLVPSMVSYDLYRTSHAFLIAPSLVRY